MGLQHVAAAVADYNRWIVLADAFGHLAPKPRTTYQCTILFTHSAYGDITLLDTSFPELPDSPWLFEDMQEFIAKEVMKRKRSEGCVFQFQGYYRKCKTGRAFFVGKVRKCKVSVQ